MRFLSYSVALLVLCSCSSEAPQAIPETGWTYGTSDDQMRGTTSYFAQLKGRNVPVELVLWKAASGASSAYVESESSVLSCEFLIGPPIAAKFDNDPVEEIPCSQGLDNSTTLFISDADKFIARLKTGKRLTLELKPQGESPQQFSLDVAGLQWPPPGWAEKPQTSGATNPSK